MKLRKQVNITAKKSVWYEIWNSKIRRGNVALELNTQSFEERAESRQLAWFLTAITHYVKLITNHCILNLFSVCFKHRLLDNGMAFCPK